MFKKTDKEVNIKNLNDVIGLTKRILHIAYFLLILIGIYAATMLCKEWKIVHFILELLAITSPLFVGIFVAWLFDPIVKWLQRKGIRRIFGSAIVYILFLGGLFIIISAIIPMLSDQINDFATSIPGIFDTVKSWIDNIFDGLNKIENFNANSIKLDLFAQLEQFGTDLASSLPEIMMNLVKSIFSGLGVFLVGIIIGFYLLVGFDSVNDTFITLVPKRHQKDTRDLMNEVNSSLRSFVQGALLDSTFIFIITSIGLWIAGLKAPLLFGLFCGITNVIPYAGPYIGGAPAVIVGFSQSTPVGIFSLIVIALIQFLEGNFLQPIIMSRTTKLHPVTIMLGLLIFGHFWGIIGMLISTPVIAAIKAIIMFFDEKYNILTFN